MPSEPVALKPTQDDRKAAAPIMKHLYGNHDATGADTLFERAVLRGDYDYHYIIQAFAAHRTPPASEPPRPVDGDGLVARLTAQASHVAMGIAVKKVDVTDATMNLIDLARQAAAHIAHTAGLMEEAMIRLEQAAHNLETGAKLYDCPGLTDAARLARAALAKLEAQGHVHRQA